MDANHNFKHHFHDLGLFLAINQPDKALSG
jgi:hypothetical protein